VGRGTFSKGRGKLEGRGELPRDAENFGGTCRTSEGRGELPRDAEKF